ncbi:MAG TPA: hypothetical protein VF594_09700 [Rubricoccaceae bacterium]|jgi:hypothetical protein
MTTEQQTLIVSVNANADDESRMQQVGAKVGAGWRVVQTIMLSGEEAGPGGGTDDFMRLQVTVEREIDDDNVVVDADRGGAADLRDIAVTAAFDDSDEAPTGEYIAPGSGLPDEPAA